MAVFKKWDTIKNYVLHLEFHLKFYYVLNFWYFFFLNFTFEILV